MPMIEVSETSLPEVLKVVRPIFRDHRGIYTEEYNEQEYFNAGIRTKWVSNTSSLSPHKTLRGLHGDPKTWKLISCPFGELYLVVLDYREGSESFGKWEGFTLNPENGVQILIPPGFANGHLILSDWAMFHYNQSEYYTDGGNQFTVKWNDQRFNIHWPIRDPILSERDRKGGK